ncbi:MAG: acyl-CoA dehydrogenase family protein, partial [Burkholderiales bacterium]
MHEFRFDPLPMPEAAQALRREVRAFIAEEVARGAFTPSRNSWSSFDADFSRKCGARGYIGMRWPKEYGGHERSALERYVVTEEMLAGGAPVGAHWIADRQSGNQILRYGSERAKRTIP